MQDSPEESPVGGGSPRAVLPATVYAVDDDQSLLDLIAKVGERCGLRTVPCRTAQDFLEAYDAKQPGCLLIDIYLPDMNGMQLLDLIVERKWRIPVVMMTGRAEVEQAVHAFKAGSLDFLQKPFTLQQLEAVIRRAVDLDARWRDEDKERGDVQRRIGNLTPREKQVMQLVVAGRSNKLIAAELGLSPKTVEVHRANVMHKMGAKTLPDLVKMVVTRGGEAANEPPKPKAGSEPGE